MRRVVAVDAREYAKSQAAGLTEPPEGWDMRDDKGNLPGVARGFDYAPGESVADELGGVVTAKMGRLQARIAADLRKEVGIPLDPYAGLSDCDAVDFGENSFAEVGCLAPLPGQQGWKDAGRPDLRRVSDDLRLDRPLLLEAATERGGAVSVLAGALALSADSPLRLMRTPVEVARLSYDDLPHLVQKEARERYANFIIPTLQDPYEIWGVEYADGVRNRYIGIFKGGRDLMVVLRVNLDGSLMWNIMQSTPQKMNSHRMGSLLYGK